MKKLITLALTAAAMAGTVYSQSTVPNAGFENWNTVGTYEEPNGWATSNLFTFLDSVPVTVEKTIDAHSGEYAVKLSTKRANADLENNLQIPYDTMPGLLSSGSFNTGILNFPFNVRPTATEFYAKYTKVGNDTGAAVITLTKWDSQNNQKITVAQAAGFISGNISTYQLVSLNFIYLTADVPDSINILILSSVENFLGNNIDVVPYPGTTMYVDDISFPTTIPNAVTEIGADIDFKLYPNPTSGNLNIRCIGYNFGQGALSLDVVDMTGRIVQSHSFNTVLSSTDVSSLATGMYIYRLKDQKGVIKTGKFNIVH